MILDIAGGCGDTLVVDLWSGDLTMADHNLEQELKLSSAQPGDSLLERGADCLEALDLKLVASDEDEKQAAPENLPPDSCLRQESIRIIGNFQLGELLGSGTLGKVFQARNVHTNGEFALKIISAEYCRSSAAGQHLLEGLKTASGVVSPNLAAYYDCGCADGTVYLVSDCLDARTLNDLIASREDFQTERFIDIFRQVCHALKSLHQQNLVHGNLKPSNIFLLSSTQGHDFAKLVDFGIVSGFSEEQKDEFMRRSASGDGCVNYMSPEQCLGYVLDGRSDIYSLGLIMYEMLSGSPLVTGHSKMHTVMKQLNLRPRCLTESRKDLPESLTKIVMKCLEKNRASRYFSVDDLELDLDLAEAEVKNLAGLEELTETPIPEQSKDKSSKEQRIKTALSAVICAGVLGCISVAVSNLIQEKFAPNNYAPPRLDRFGFLAPRRFPRSSEASQRLAESYVTSAISTEKAQIRFAQNQPGPMLNTIGPVAGMIAAPSQFTDRELIEAAFFYGRAIDAYQREHPGLSDRENKEALAALQTRLGEVHARGTFADQGGRLDRKIYYTSYELGANGYPRLQPSFPGLTPSFTLLPDYVNAKVAFDQARKTLGNDFGLKNADLLWDSCFTEFNLGNYEEAINIQRSLIAIYEKQDVQNKEALIMSYDNLGRMYLTMGQAGKAVHEIKKAREIDRKAYKLGDGEHTDQIGSDLAYAYLKEGNLLSVAAAATIAHENLKLIASRSTDAGNNMSPDSEMSAFNTGILSKALRQMGKSDEADKLELQLYRKGLNSQILP